MGLQDEILQKPYGIQMALANKTGLSPATINRCLHRVYCGSHSAKLIAAAFGKPKRWPELVKEREPDVT
jgi:lambda repressor-like predicted transcriptional regulator